MAFDLNKITARLMFDEPFFAAISRRVDKRASNAVPTAGVRVNPVTGYFEMLYNPEFFEKLPDGQRLGVLKHEFYHLVFQHVTERLPEEGMTQIWNVATDLAINSHIADELPEMALVPGRDKFSDYPTGLSAEAYLELLKNDDQFKQGDGEQGDGDGEGGGQGGGQGLPDTLDDHGQWGEGVDEATEAIAKERLKDVVRKAAEEAAKSNSWGSVSQSLRKEIMKGLQTTIDWKKMLRYFIKTSRRAEKRSTVRRLNRKYPRIHAGRKVNRLANIAVSIDQSGSVCDNMLAKFFAELNGLSKLASFTVVPFDTIVDESKVYEWKKGETRAWERVLSGGTCFDAPTKYVNDREFDGHIVLTDMCAPKPISSKCQRMWITDEYGKTNSYFSTNEVVVAVKT
mgnify:FL=1